MRSPGSSPPATTPIAPSITTMRSVDQPTIGQPFSGPRRITASERALRRQHADDARISLGRDVQRTREPFERGLDDVVRVPPGEHADVQVHAELVYEGEQKIVNQLDVEAADAGLLRLQIVGQERPAAEIDDDADECLVEWNGRLAEAADAFLGA